MNINRIYNAPIITTSYAGSENSRTGLLNGREIQIVEPRQPRSTIVNTHAPYSAIRVKAHMLNNVALTAPQTGKRAFMSMNADYANLGINTTTRK